MGNLAAGDVLGVDSQEAVAVARRRPHGQPPGPLEFVPVGDLVQAAVHHDRRSGLEQIGRLVDLEGHQGAGGRQPQLGAGRGAEHDRGPSRA